MSGLEVALGANIVPTDENLEKEKQSIFKLKIYYAHSIGLYNTPQETRDIELLESLGFEVINPNTLLHHENYQREGMGYFKNVIWSCDALAFRANFDNSIGSGVALEIDFAGEKNIPVIELPSNISRRRLSLEETRGYLTETGER